MVRRFAGCSRTAKVFFFFLVWRAAVVAVCCDTNGRELIKIGAAVSQWGLDIQLFIFLLLLRNVCGGVWRVLLEWE